MRGIPSVYTRIKTSYLGINFDLVFKDNHLFLNGDSGQGKSFLVSCLKDLVLEYDRIVVFSYSDKKDDILSKLKNSYNLFVIDNANIVLDTELRRYIASDFKNQYLIIGRDPSNLMLGYTNYISLDYNISNKTLSFRYMKCFNNNSSN